VDPVSSADYETVETAEIQDVMSAHAPIVRDGPTLQAGLDKIEDLRARAQACGTGGSPTRAFNPGWHTVYDLRSMLVNAEALLRSALERKESRGAHARSDFLKTDELGCLNYVVEQKAGGMRVTSEPIPAMPDCLAEILHRSYATYTPEETE
jgi:succinate dehydrogenase / fumarate reductase, flavoprotein subunit